MLLLLLLLCKGNVQKQDRKKNNNINEINKISFHTKCNFPFVIVSTFVGKDIVKFRY